MQLHDSGNRITFLTGAVRDIWEGKGRFDLLPLDIIGERLGDPVLCHINNYIREGTTESLWEAISLFGRQHYCSSTVKGIDWTELLIGVAKQYEAGAKKYSDRNWENGQPIHCYINSAISHYLKAQRGDNEEPHDRAFVWNIFGALWTHKHLPHLRDLPFANVEYENQISFEIANDC